MNAASLSRYIAAAIKAHASHANTPKDTVRKWDGKTPYGIHPVWCALTLLHETKLPAGLREDFALALLFHDVLEDTNAPLPPNLSDSTRSYIQSMTFNSSSEEMEKIWDFPPQIKLLKLYDKVSNLLDGAWMSPEKYLRYLEYTQRLADEVAKTYGELNIVRIARGLDVKTDY